MFTTHGYEIPQTTPAEYTPDQFESCGGIGTCEQCTRETEFVTNENAKALTDVHFHDVHPEQAELGEIEPHPSFVPIELSTSKDEE